MYIYTFPCLPTAWSTQWNLMKWRDGNIHPWHCPSHDSWVKCPGYKSMWNWFDGFSAANEKLRFAIPCFFFANMVPTHVPFLLGSVQLRSAWMPLRLLYSHCHTSNSNVQGRTQCKCLVHTQKHLCESPSPKTTIRWFTPWLRHKLNGGWPDTESAHISSVPFSPTEESMLPLSSGHKLAKEEGPGALRFIQRFVPWSCGANLSSLEAATAAQTCGRGPNSSVRNRWKSCWLLAVHFIAQTSSTFHRFWWILDWSVLDRAGSTADIPW